MKSSQCNLSMYSPDVCIVDLFDNLSLNLENNEGVVIQMRGNGILLYPIMKVSFAPTSPLNNGGYCSLSVVVLISCSPRDITLWLHLFNGSDLKLWLVYCVSHIKSLMTPQPLKSAAHISFHSKRQWLWSGVKITHAWCTVNALQPFGVRETVLLKVT